MVGQSGWGRVVNACVFVFVSACVLSACVSMWQKLGGIERALTLCLYGPTVNGDKGPARGTAQPDDVTAHVPGQLGEAGGLQQESLLGLHGGFGAAAVSHRHHVVGLARTVTPWARLLCWKEGESRGHWIQLNPQHCVFVLILLICISHCVLQIFCYLIFLSLCLLTSSNYYNYFVVKKGSEQNMERISHREKLIFIFAFDKTFDLTLNASKSFESFFLYHFPCISNAIL